jgi:hypothetical protein
MELTEEQMESPGKPKRSPEEEVNRGMKVLFLSMLMGLLSAPVYALYGTDRSQFLVTLSVGTLLCGTAALTGIMLGFLFGIPRTRRQEDGKTAKQPKESLPQSSPFSYHANTNLEEISDWLTKILVGVGLTQINAIKQGFSELTRQAAEGLGGQPHSQIYAGALIGFSVVPGFLYGFLWTRLYLPYAMRTADHQEALLKRMQETDTRVDSVSRKVEDLKQQDNHDAVARKLIERQLNPIPDYPMVTQNELNEALKLASEPIRGQAFNQAYKIRNDNWRNSSTKDRMALSIPVFRALIHNAPDQYHMNHGQLGFALKDKKQPAWEEAESELSAAIRIRGDWREKGWLHYELARAVCRIMLDPDYKSDKASAPNARAAILADLKAATNDKGIQGIVHKDNNHTGKTIRKWLALNQEEIAKLISGG